MKMLKFILAGAMILATQAIQTEDLSTLTSTIQSVASPIISQKNEASVIRVVDGDTLIVDYNNQETRIRLIGVDTPESVHPDSTRNGEEGIAASDYVKGLLSAGDIVELEFDEELNDIYGRTLAYVYLDGMMLNAHLLEEGWAEIATFPPNTKYLDLFQQIVDDRA